jgi:5'-3' exonuclease
MKKRTALIDADGIAYKIAAANETLDSYNDIENLVHEYMNFLFSNTEATHAVCFIKGAGNFRKDIAKIRPYKGNRNPKRIKWLEAVYHILEKEYLAIASNGAEADDYIASYAKQLKDSSEDYIICSHDKDLKQICGKHFDLNDFDFIDIDEKDAAYRLYLQILCGDSSDNIQGIPKVGIKTAAKILDAGEQAPNGYLVSCIMAYKDFYGESWPMLFAENYQLVYLLNNIDLSEPIENGKFIDVNEKLQNMEGAG